MKTTAVLAVGLCALGVQAQSNCETVLVPTYTPPSIAPGWQAQLVVQGLKKPRSLQFDSAGALLVVESGRGLSRITFTDDGGTCLVVKSNDLLIDLPALNHGLTLSDDGKTIYASSVESVFAWQYDPATGKVTAMPQEVVTGMSNNDLTTRTLLMSRKQPGTLIVSRGSGEDFDVDALDITTGLAQLRAFDLSNFTSSSPAYSFDSSGTVLGWGLRNAVGVVEHPITGGIYSLDQGVDGMTRSGQDIHENNPGEELNYHGTLGSSEHQGGNYGYPSCFSCWDTAIPDNSGLVVGDQFPMMQNSTLNDLVCERNYVGPRLVFPAHMSPLDMEFTSDGSMAFVTFHGSIDKTNPVGYALSALSFDASRGDPSAPEDSTTALSTILTNPDHSKCPTGCLRPAGLTVQPGTGRLFMTGDSTGEIYVFAKTVASPTSTASGTIVTATGKPNAAAGVWRWETRVLGMAVGLVAVFFVM